MISAAANSVSAASPTGPYVALGDSYSAGSGILPLDLTANPLCARTTKNYPHLVAAAINPESFTDATCGGADTNDFYEQQYIGAPAQLSKVTSDTKLVTLSIGGNDNNTFINMILACGSAGAATLGFGSPCKSIYGTSFKNDVINKTGPAVRKALADIRAKAPGAHVLIVGYPRILPASGNCFLTMPIAIGDVPYVNDVEATLNGVIQQAAGATGAEYVDTWTPSTGHDACKAIGTRWVEPAFWGTNFVPVHPNALGESKMAGLVLNAL
jgi:lysophospholipase L1-like esterase